MTDRARNNDDLSDDSASVSYQPDPGAGGAPMSQQEASGASTSSTDARDAAASGDPNQNLGKNWTGETAPDIAARENPPQRGGQTGTEANDAF